MKIPYTPRARSSALSRISMIIHLFWFVILIYIVWPSIFPSRMVRFDGMNAERDVVRIASELGRLDFVAMALAILGVTLAVAALFSYQVIRAAAMDAARDEARERVSRELPSLITAIMIAEALKSNPRIYQSIVSQIRVQISLVESKDLGGGDADAIARAVD